MLNIRTIKMEKIDKKNKIIGSFLIIGVLVIVLCSLVSAIGVGSSYSAEIPLKMYPGEEISVFWSLQNHDIEEEISLEGTLLRGSEIASLDKGPYKVPYKGVVLAEVKIKIPETASIGQEYDVLSVFKQVGSEGKGGVLFSQSVQSIFKVVVVEKPEQPALEEGISIGWIILAVVLVIAVIAIVWFIIKSRREK